MLKERNHIVLAPITCENNVAVTLAMECINIGSIRPSITDNNQFSFSAAVRTLERLD